MAYIIFPLLLGICILETCWLYSAEQGNQVGGIDFVYCQYGEIGSLGDLVVLELHCMLVNHVLLIYIGGS